MPKELSEKTLDETRAGYAHAFWRADAPDGEGGDGVTSEGSAPSHGLSVAAAVLAASAAIAAASAKDLVYLAFLAGSAMVSFVHS
jgi:hypothetical protein